MKLLRSLPIGILISSSLGLIPANLYAQIVNTPEEPVLPLRIGAADRAATGNYSNLKIHVLPSLNAAASPEHSLRGFSLPGDATSLANRSSGGRGGAPTR